MDIRYFFNGVAIDGRTRDYIDKKIDNTKKLLESNLELRGEVEINLDKKGKFRVEVMIKTPYKLYRAEETTESVEGSIDIAIEELKRQIKCDKDRRKTLIKRGGRSIKKRVVTDKNARF